MICDAPAAPEKRRRKIVGCSCTGKDCRHHKDYAGKAHLTHTVISVPSNRQRIVHNDFIDMTDDPTGEGEVEIERVGGEDYLIIPEKSDSAPSINPTLKIDGTTLEKRKRFQEDFLRNIPEMMRNEVLAQMMEGEDSVFPRVADSEKYKEPKQRQDMSQEEEEIETKQLRSIAVKKKGTSSRKGRKQQVGTNVLLYSLGTLVVS